MDFAKSQLLKYGWEDGKGLGKNESGMKDHINVKLKMDKTGIGHDIGKEYTNHWWDNVFNKTASSIQVTDTQDGVEIKRSSKHKLEISKNLQTYSKKAMAYGNFIRKATLSNGYEREEKSPSEDCIEETKSSTISAYCLVPENEEEIFSKCGGRTAHKGARHGLKLNGKLQRIQEQEQLLLDKFNSTLTNQCEPSNVSVNGEKEIYLTQCEDEIKRTKRKKKNKKSRLETDAEIVYIHENSMETNGSKRKKRKQIEEVTSKIDQNMGSSVWSECKAKKKKTKDHGENVYNIENNDTYLGNDSHTQNIDIVEVTLKKKKKKKKEKKMKE